MSGLTLERLNELMTRHPDFELEGIAVEFLEAFAPDRPLEEDALSDWMYAEGKNPRDVLSAAHQAIACRWIENSPDGLRLTKDGKKKIRSVYAGMSKQSST